MTLEHLEAIHRSIKQRLRSLNPMQNKERELLEESLTKLNTSIAKEKAKSQQTEWVVTYTLTNK